MTTTTVYLCSKSDLKVEVAQRLVYLLTKVHQENGHATTMELVPLDLNYKTIPQPTGVKIVEECQSRITMAKKFAESANSIFIAFENGIVTLSDGSVYDVCCLCVCPHDRGDVMTYYYSFGIPISSNLYDDYHSKKSTSFISKLIGPDNTFGEYMESKFNVDKQNWMKDPKFGNCDRRIQLTDCMYKFLLDYFTSRIPNYPKSGVMFKDTSSILFSPTLIDILFKSIERFVRDNFDVNNIDLFAGLDARGFYFGSYLAVTFNKSFLPIRKASKIPKTDSEEIVTVSYSTEYSHDQWGLRPSDLYTGKKVLIVDDLLATGGSIVGAIQLLEQVGATVAGAVTIYDVEALREVAKTTLGNYKYAVLLNNDNVVPNDFKPLVYLVPDELIARKTTFERYFTMDTVEWNFDTNSQHPMCVGPVSLICPEQCANLGQQICQSLSQCTTRGVACYQDIQCELVTGKFSNGETRVKINSNIRNKHVIIVCQLRPGHVNDDLMELFLILDTCNRSDVQKKTVVMPYLGYSRSDKKDEPRTPIASASVIRILNNLGVDNLVSLDLHSGQLQGLMDKGFHNLYMMPYLCDFIYNTYLIGNTNYNDKFVLIAPDAGSSKTVKAYSHQLQINNVIMDKTRDYSTPSTVAKSRMIGNPDDIRGKTGIIIDDMADTCGTIVATVNELSKFGIQDVIIIVTHGILSGQAIKNINQCEQIKEIVVTNSLPQQNNLLLSPKLRVVSCAELIARAIDGILSGKSISRCFKPKLANH